MKKTGQPNSLIHESSPYLLQHAYNPVNWKAWNNQAWELARTENKLVIVSIGYSACHWCHVMEHQSFEDNEVAAIMNEYFVSIKVDREERPDIDNVYMEAVQIMTGRGGWPLNCITLPDGKPVYGGTYFPREGWMSVLQSLADLYLNDPKKVIEYAAHLQEGLEQSEIIKSAVSGEAGLVADENIIIGNYINSFDSVYGGPRKSPKFPMPCNYEFLLNYGILQKNEKVLDHVRLTLTKMAYGGIYDQLAGGFARYSVDEIWKVPHFEKMLYDNAQLISLYAKGYARFKDPLFKKTVEHTVAFLNTELLSPTNLYYSALDADSEGVEGKFYVWTEAELKSVLNNDEFNFVCEYYSINEYGYWEHDNYVLIRKEDEKSVAAKLGISLHVLEKLKLSADSKLLEFRSKRIRPGLDDKCLLSWNALTLKGLAEASVYLKDATILANAKKLHAAIETCFFANKKWYRSFKNNTQTILAFAEDIALLAEANLAMYETQFDETYLNRVIDLVQLLVEDFYEPTTGMFYFTSKNADKLIVRKTEIFDNVISSPNSVIALVLYKAGVLTGNEKWENMAKQMVINVNAYFENAPQALGNWLSAWLMMYKQETEIVATGNNCLKAIEDYRKDYLPLVVWCASTKNSSLPLLTSRLINGQTTIYECKNKACNLPIVFNS